MEICALNAAGAAFGRIPAMRWPAPASPSRERSALHEGSISARQSRRGIRGGAHVARGLPSAQPNSCATEGDGASRSPSHTRGRPARVSRDERPRRACRALLARHRLPRIQQVLLPPLDTATLTPGRAMHCDQCRLRRASYAHCQEVLLEPGKTDARARASCKLFARPNQTCPTASFSKR